MYLQWVAPEVLKSARNTSADVFSLGCVFMEILTVIARRSLSDFKELRQRNGDSTYGNNIKETIHWVDHLSESLTGRLKMLAVKIQCMVSYDPKERPSAEKVWRFTTHPLLNTDNETVLCGQCCRSSYTAPAYSWMETCHTAVGKKNQGIGSRMWKQLLPPAKWGPSFSLHHVLSGQRTNLLEYLNAYSRISLIFVTSFTLLNYFQSLKAQWCTVALCSVLICRTMVHFTNAHFHELFAVATICIAVQIIFIENQAGPKGVTHV